MKKTGIILMTIIYLLTFAGCGSEEKAREEMMEKLDRHKEYGGINQCRGMGSCFGKNGDGIRGM